MRYGIHGDVSGPGLLIGVVLPNTDVSDILSWVCDAGGSVLERPKRAGPLVELRVDDESTIIARVCSTNVRYVLIYGCARLQLGIGQLPWPLGMQKCTIESRAYCRLRAMLLRLHTAATSRPRLVVGYETWGIPRVPVGSILVPSSVVPEHLRDGLAVVRHDFHGDEMVMFDLGQPLPLP